MARIAPRPVTTFENPYESLRAVTTRKVRYKRADGVDLAGDLHLPPGYDPQRDGRLPLLLEAYPTEFKDKAAAGMVDSSPHAFVRPSWGSPVFWALRGYAVLENAQFPIVGDAGGHGDADVLTIAEFVRFVRDDAPTDTSPLGAWYAVAAAIQATASLRANAVPLDVPALPDELIAYFRNNQHR